MDDKVEIPVLGADAEITFLRVDAAVVTAARKLPHAPERYFNLDGQTQLLPLSMLIQSRARSEGIANAVKLMAAAHEGRQARRAPISVKRLRDGYLVLDGNSTVAVAKAAGWPELPCKLA